MNYEKSNKEKIKRILKHAIHFIGYICTFIVLCLSIVMGVQSCNGQENRQDKPIQQLNANNDFSQYKPLYGYSYTSLTFTGNYSTWFNYLPNQIDALQDYGLFPSGLLDFDISASGYIQFDGRSTQYPFNVIHVVHVEDTLLRIAYIYKENGVNIFRGDIAIDLVNMGFTSYATIEGSTISDLDNILIAIVNFSDYDINNTNGRYFLNIFYSMYYCSSQFTTNVTLKPYMDLSEFKSGVYYPLLASINSINYSVDTSIERYLFGIYIDYDDTIYGIYLWGNKEVIGSVEYDSNNVPYFNYYRKTNFNENTFPFNGVMINLYLQTDYLRNFLPKQLVSCYKDVNNSLVINFSDIALYFDWYQYQGWLYGCLLQGSDSPFYQTIGGNALYRMDLDFNYKIKGLDNFNLNKIMFGYNPSSGQGTINFVDSVNVFNIYTYDSSFSLANSGDYYKGSDYGLSSEFPYYITLIINGGISVRDFTILSYFTTPTSIKLSNINPVGGENMSNVFTLLHGTFSGVISALDFYVLPGITLITLMMIPLAIALVLAIIKVLRK